MKKIEEIKRGDILEYKGKEYIREGYIRETKKYEISDIEDISKFKYLKKGTTVN